MAKLACVQMNSSADIGENLQIASQFIGQAAAEGAELILLPENFALLSTKKLLAAGQQEYSTDGPIRSFLAEQARHHGVWLVAGSIPIAARPDGSRIEDRVRTVCLVIDATGTEVARYDKIHLFDVDVEDDYGSYRESDAIEPGEQVVVIDTPVGRLGLSICYDLRFPELHRQLLDRGAEIITVPSAFTAATGEAHWHTLLKARAIENICYLAAANQCGEHTKGRASYGHSMVVDPWGEIVAEEPDREGVAIANIDLDYLATLRRKMPVLQHRKL